MTTKQTIRERFYDMAYRDREYGNELQDFVVRQKIRIFYETQIQKLLEEIVPKERGTIPYNTSAFMVMSDDKDIAFNAAIEEIKNRIKQAGF